MAKKSVENTTVLSELLAQTKIQKRPIENEVKKSFIAYAMAVNVSRAIPDVRDGLKPVHRRILYSMNELGLTSDKAYRKCALIVGDVLGKYHPHGDSSVYDALVRLAQDFSIRDPLVDGHGNFGSVDGDPPAAYRYTEARMSKISAEMLRDLDRDTVDFYPNFDDTRMQPVVLPARFPNLLVNGADGIAVGMATSIPPHNLGEVIDATVALIENPELSVEDLMEYIPAPDYPTGALVLGRAAIRQAYKTGKGGAILRARTEIEEKENGRTSIIVTELPYQINKALLIKNIADQIKDKRIEGIADLKEQSDRNGMRIVIELKRDANAQVVLNTLYKQTNLQCSNSMILLALVDGVPRVLNLKQILEEYVKHQINVIERRTRFNLAKALEREHILLGLVKALANIDEVIATIKASKERADAIQNLMNGFELSEKQAIAILEMRLQRLVGLEVEKLQAELAELEIAITEYRAILADPEKVRTIIRTELLEIKDKYATPRKSELSYDESEINLADLIERHEVVLSMTYYGYVKRQPADEYRAQRRGGKGITAHKTKEEDFVSTMYVCNSHDDVMFFTNFGKVYCIKAYEVPEASRTSKGRAIVNLLNLAEGEKVSAYMPIKDYEHGYLMMATKNGLIKKTDISEFAKIRNSGKIAISLVGEDELISVALTDGENELLMACSSGKCIRFSETNIRKTGRTSQGVRSMRMDEGETVVDMAIVKEGSQVITITENGYGKRSDIEEYRLQGRAGKGIKAGTFNEKTGKLISLKQVNPDDDVMLIADNGIIIRTQVSEISKIGRDTQGVRVMRVGEGKVVAVALTPHVDETEDTGEGESAETAELPETENE